MIFYHTITNWHGVVRPGWNDLDPVTHQPIRRRPVEVQFRRHQFDTELAKRSLGWTDEDHELVVQALLNPPEGTPFYFDRVAGRLNVDLNRHPGEVNYGPNGPEGVPPQPCAFLVVTSDGAAPCSQPSLPGDEFCGEHRNKVNQQISAAKARESRHPAGVG